ncbi:MAG: ABC transporter substrate-binding protein [Thermoleophilia bacterium]
MLRARHLLATLAAAAAVLALAACGPRAEPTGELPPRYPATARGAGDAPTRVDRLPARIVAVDRGAAELLLELGVDARLVGAPSGTPSLPAGAAPVVSASGEIDVPRIAALEPDLVVASPASDQVELARIEDAVDAPVYLQPASSVDDVVRATIELGHSRASRSPPVRSSPRSAATSRRSSSASPRWRPCASSSTWGCSSRRAITRSSPTSFGGPEGSPSPRATRGTPLEPAAVAAAAPDVYLATSSSRQTLEGLRADPVLAGTPAATDGRFAIIPADAVDVAGPGIARGLEAVAAAIHPDAFR